jgi:hypothetical protein
VYRNTQALPRVFLVDRQHTAPSADAALAAATAPGFDGRRVAVTERTLPGLPEDAGGAASAASPSPGTARLVSYGAERVVANSSASQRSLLVLSDVFYPGWKVTVDGHPAPVERVDYLLRGVPLAPGTHRVEFRYQPASFRAGWIVSLLATLTVLAVALVGWRRHRRGRVEAG